MSRKGDDQAGQIQALPVAQRRAGGGSMTDDQDRGPRPGGRAGSGEGARMRHPRPREVYIRSAKVSMVNALTAIGQGLGGTVQMTDRSADAARKLRVAIDWARDSLRDAERTLNDMDAEVSP